MNLEQIKNEIFNFLKSNDNLFYKNLTIDIAFTFDSIIKDIYDHSQKDFKMSSDWKTIDNIVFELLGFVLVSPLNQQTCKFIRSYCEILFNWNRLVYKNNKLGNVILSVNRFIEIHGMMSETMISMKELIERNKDLGGWYPPVFEIAKEYFEQLLKKHESEENVSNEETRCIETE